MASHPGQKFSKESFCIILESRFEEGLSGQFRRRAIQTGHIIALAVHKNAFAIASNKKAPLSGGFFYNAVQLSYFTRFSRDRAGISSITTASASSLPASLNLDVIPLSLAESAARSSAALAT